MEKCYRLWDFGGEFKDWNLDKNSWEGKGVNGEVLLHVGPVGGSLNNCSHC